MDATERERLLQAHLKSPSAATRDAVVKANMELVYFMAKRKFHIPHPLMADAVQEGVIGILTALDNYQPELGKFSVYCGYWIKARIGHWIEREVRQNRCSVVSRQSRRESNTPRNVLRPKRVSSVLGDFEKEGGGSERTVDPLDIIPATSPDPDRHLDAERVRALLGTMRLSSREVSLIAKHLLGDSTLPDLAIEFGVSKQRVGQIKEVLIRRINAELEAA